MNKLSAILVLLLPTTVAVAEDRDSLRADRTAIERVYHQHRTGATKPFEEAMPPAQIGRLVELDARKEAILRNRYEINISPAMVAAEVARIDATTRAPEILGEIKHALGDDPARFARALARPIIVERILRERFDNDDKIHAPQREAMDSMRAKLLATRAKGTTLTQLLAWFKEAAKDRSAETCETEWLRTARPADDSPARPAQSAGPTKATVQGGVYAVEATAQVAQPLPSPGTSGAGHDQAHDLDDMPVGLRNLLLAQLHRPGDISAVVETPGGFAIYLAMDMTPAKLVLASAFLHKTPYEAWLADQPAWTTSNQRNTP